MVLVRGVQGKGDIKGNKALDEAYRLGETLVLNKEAEKKQQI